MPDDDCLPASAFGAPHRRDRVWVVAYPNGEGEPSLSRAERERVGESGQPSGAPVADADSTTRSAAGRAGEALPRSGAVERSGRRGSGERDAWATEPDVGRVAHGIPARVDRLAALGNALVPQIAEWIGWRIVEYEEGRLAA